VDAAFLHTTNTQQITLAYGAVRSKLRQSRPVMSFLKAKIFAMRNEPGSHRLPLAWQRRRTMLALPPSDKSLG
jgi:hypothetical protein